MADLESKPLGSTVLERLTGQGMALRAYQSASKQSSVMLLLSDRPLPASAELARLIEPFRREFKLLILESALPSANEVLSFAQQLVAFLITNGIKRATVFGIGRGALIGEAMAVVSPGFVRRIALLDAAARPKPSLLGKMVDQVERFLPLGLPFRKLSRAYDARADLHRIRCPGLVMVSAEASRFLTRQAILLARRLPNAVLLPLSKPSRTSTGVFSPEVVTLMHRFLQAAVKQPQKGSANPVAAVS